MLILKGHAATVRGAVGVKVECPACGYRAVAWVEAKGEGSAHTGLLDRKDPTAARALERAEADAHRIAAAAAPLAICPACGKRDRDAARREIGRRVVHGLLATVVLTGIAAILVPWRVAGIFGIFGAVLAAATEWKRWRRTLSAAASLQVSDAPGPHGWPSDPASG